MFWSRKKENNFQLRTLIWGPGIMPCNETVVLYIKYATRQCSAKKFRNWGQCPTTFEKVGTFPKTVGHNTRFLNKQL